MTILEVNHLSVNYLKDDGTPLKAVQDVCFKLEQGRSLGLVGESGCGKTTVILSLLRLLPEAGRIVDGQVLLNGHDLLRISESDMNKVRWKQISMVFQGAMNALNPVRTVESQIVEAINVHNSEASHNDSKKRACELLEMVGIPAERGKQYPHQYSGGMKQRAVIAMALACKPSILIADEPTTALDVMIQAQIIRLLQNLQRDLDLTLILVTHDLGVVAEICDDVLVMYGGMTAEYASSDSIFNCSKHPYTQRLLKAFPDIEKPGAELVWIPGSPPRLDALPTGCRFQPRCHLAEEICRNETPVLTFNPPDHGFACHVMQRRAE
ncbi:MAG: ABC transporter ATP-binding protein [Chloroflexi bacterium]|nr:ABC transporter ATP-binding protein [Chloroflexota bacterium]